jgi:arginine/lysine/ornithine decarboxylase
MDDAYEGFWDMYDEFRVDCADLLEGFDTAKRHQGHGKKAKWQAAVENGVDKRQKAKKELTEKRMAALVRDLERMGANGYESL